MQIHSQSFVKIRKVKGFPGCNAWKTLPNSRNISSTFYKSNVLLIAQQLYANQLNEHCSQLTDAQRQTLLNGLTDTVPLSDRCAPVPACNKGYKYIESDGRCNNLKNPKWGQQYAPYKRLFPAYYDDGVYTIRKSVTNESLPLPREIVNDVLMDPGHRSAPFKRLNVGGVLMGQYVAHDLSDKKIYQMDEGGFGLRCCSKDYKNLPPGSQSYYGCLPNKVPKNDPILSKISNSCMDFVRTQPIFSNDCKIGPAEHSNGVTHGLDQSILYGPNSDIQNSVRTFVNGKLVGDIGVMTKDCKGGFCSYSGDRRAPYFAPLALWHSVFIRKHNKIADQLAALNKQWNDQILFDETRRIVTAIYQHIVYNELLPILLGTPKTTIRHDLWCGKDSTYCGAYNASVDPSVLTEFTNAAFRIFHYNVPEKFNLYNAKYKKTASYHVNDIFSGAELLETNYTEVMRGNLLDKSNYGVFSDDMRSTVFKGRDGPGVDLLSIDVARGRDAGLSPYHVFLNSFLPSGQPIKNWDDLRVVFTMKNIEKLKKVYKSPFDIDLIVGCHLEEKAYAYVGPVTAFILQEQFYRSKFGNRHFYSFPNAAYPFTAEQITEIHKHSWASLLCESADIEDMLVRALEHRTLSNGFVKCSTFKPFNLRLWKAST